MKVLIISIVVIMVFVINLDAQNFKYGIQAGFDMSRAPVKNSPDFNTTFSNVSNKFFPTFNVNAYFGFRSNNFWEVSLEPGFMQNRIGDNFLGSDSPYKLNYLQVPILFNVHFMKSYFISVGGEFSYLLSADLNFETVLMESIELFRRPHISGIVAINYNFLEHITFGMRYFHGFTTISDIKIRNEESGAIDYVDQFNQYFQFLLRYRF